MNVTKPGLTLDELPAVPDLKDFQLPPVQPGNNCNANAKAISLDITDESGVLEIIICTFLEFELEGDFSGDGLLDFLEESLSFELDSKYVLKGALSTGIKITVASLTESPLIELDPIFMQLHSEEDLSGSVSFGLLKPSISGSALLQGQFSLSYCSVCNGIYPSDGYQQAGENSSFYYSRLVGYDLEGGLELSAGAYGVELDIARDKIQIQDNDMFDDVPPFVQLPDVQSLRDSIKFSPQNAVSKFIISGHSALVRLT